jgi:hypothetical protein
MTTTAAPTLFDEEPATPAPRPATPERPEGVYGLRPA